MSDAIANPITVVLADGNELVRNVVEAVCKRYGMAVVAEVSTCRELAAACEALRPDVVVTDSCLGDGPIDGCLEHLLAVNARVVVLSSDASPERLTALLERGVSGYLLHDSAPEHVGDALQAVATGASALHPTVAYTVLEQWRRLRKGGAFLGTKPRSSLTPREFEVLAAMADGLATKAIAARLGVALKTVENHKVRIFDKLGVRTQAEAVSLAIGHSLLAAVAD